jgi:hypothetical protein
MENFNIFEVTKGEKTFVIFTVSCPDPSEFDIKKFSSEISGVATKKQLYSFAFVGIPPSSSLAQFAKYFFKGEKNSKGFEGFAFISNHLGEVKTTNNARKKTMAKFVTVAIKEKAYYPSVIGIIRAKELARADLILIPDDIASFMACLHGIGITYQGMINDTDTLATIIEKNPDWAKTRLSRTGQIIYDFYKKNNLSKHELYEKIIKIINNR